MADALAPSGPGASPTVRTLERSDAPRVQPLVSACPPLEPHTAFSYWVLAHYQAGLCVVAEDSAGELVGLAVVVPATEASDLAYLWQIGVVGGHRGTGLADRLLDDVVDRCRAAGRTHLEVSIDEENGRSRATFERLAERLSTPLAPVGRLAVDDPVYRHTSREVIYRLALA